MKTQFKTLLSLIIVSILLLPSLTIPNSALADGMLIKLDPYSDRWDYSGQTNQQAFINYENELEKMIISIGMEEASEKAVWIFPIPANPDKVAIDVVTKFPQLKGEEITKKAKSNLLDIKEFLQATQIYPIPFIMNKAQTIDISGGEETLGGESIGGVGVETDVTVYEHLEKEGITTEIITAKTAQGLYQYLKEKGLMIEQGSIIVLDHYIGKEFTFVVSWISGKEKPSLLREEIEKGLIGYLNKVSRDLSWYRKSWPYNTYDKEVVKGIQKYIPELEEALLEFNEKRRSEQQKFLTNNPEIKEKLINFLIKSPTKSLKWKIEQLKQKGVFVTFPTKKIYYPLFPTSVYGSETIPVTIRVMGFVNPKVFKDIKSYTKVEHFIDDNVRLDDELKNFYSGPAENVKYTKIEINAPSKFLTDDLWISSRAPLKTYYSSFIAQHPLINEILLLILSSIITCVMTGWIVFRELRSKNGILKLALIGLSNCLSIIGLVIATVLFRTKAKDKNIASLLNEIRQKGYIWKRRIAVILFFAALPFLSFGVVALPSFIREIVRYGGFRSGDTMPIIIVYIIPLLVLAFVLFIKRIKVEDKSLFIQLKSAGYSSWSFNPKDKMKFIFVPLFSFSFLAISWLIIKLVEFTV